MAAFELYFHSMEQVVDPQGQIRRTGRLIKTFEVSSGLHVTGEPEHCLASARSTGWTYRGVGVFLSIIPSNCSSRYE